MRMQAQGQPQWQQQQNPYAQPNPYLQPAYNQNAAPPYASNPAYGYPTGSTNATYLHNDNAGGNPYNTTGGGYPPQPGTNPSSYAGASPMMSPHQSNSAATLQGIPLYGEGCDAKAKKFVVQGWQDVWAAVLFLLCTGACCILGCYNYSQGFAGTADADANANGTDRPVDRDEVGVSAAFLAGILFAIVAFAAVLATVSLFIFYKAPKQAIIAANVAVVVLMIVSAIASFVMGSVLAGVITLLVGIANAAILYFYRSRIPFSALLMKTCTGIAMSYKGLIVTNYGLVIAFSLFTVLWSAALYPSVYRINENNGTANGSDAGIVLFAVFCYFWASQVAFNTMHVTASGVTATWYFVGGPQQMPRNPSLASFRRAITTSFGSICFGSLLVAILQFLRYLVRSQRENENEFVVCIVSCLLQCLESLVQYFNHFAFVYCAIYGYDYVTAAKKTFALASNCAFSAVFNESLINSTLTMTSIAAGVIAFIVFWVVTNMAIAILAFVVTLFVHVQLFRIIDSATTTLFVCFAEEPNTLAVVNSELYEKIYAANNGASVQV